MADETYTIDLQVTGVDRAVRSLQTMSSVVQGMGAGGSSGGAAGTADMAASFGRAAVVAAVVVAVIVALKKLVDAVLSAAKALQEFGQLQARLGSSPEQTAFLKTIGAAAGVDIGSASGRVRAAAQSGLGAAAAMQAGIRPGQIDLGTAVNQGQMVMQALMEMRRIFQSGNPSGALAFARNLDIEDLYQFVYLTNEQVKELQEDAQRNGGIFGQLTIARAFQFNTEMARLSENWETLKVLLLSSLIPAIQFFTRALIGLIDTLLSFPGLGKAKSEFDAAINGNSQALNANTAELRNLNGIYGGGNRLRGAIPAAFGPGGGFALQDALRAHTVRLGSFSVAM